MSSRKNGQAAPPPHALKVMQPFSANAAAGQYVVLLISIDDITFSGVLLYGVWIALSHLAFPMGSRDWQTIHPF